MAAQSAAAHDLRGHYRKPVEIDITLESESQFYAGFGENLSEGGIFVATHAVQPVGTRLEVVFTLPGLNRPIRVQGDVRWVRPYSETSDSPAGMGLRFVSLAAPDAEAIRAFCARRAPLFFED